MEIISYGESQLFRTISDLYPYTEYKVFIQCGYGDCYGGWGLFVGPVTVRTNEEGKDLITNKLIPDSRTTWCLISKGE